MRRLLALLAFLTFLPAQATVQEELAEVLHHDEMLVDHSLQSLTHRTATGELRAFASFRLMADGSYSNWQITRGSDNPSFDVACRAAVDNSGFARFEGKNFIVVNASFYSDSKKASVSFTSPDVAGGNSNVDRKIAQRKAIHLNTIKIMKDRITAGEKVLGPTNGKLSESINFLGNEYKEVGDWANAEKSFLRAIAIREKANGAQSVEVAQSINDLGEMYLAKGDQSAAEKQFQTVLDMKDLKPSGKIKTMQARAKMLLKNGKQAEADEIYKQINDIMTNHR